MASSPRPSFASPTVQAYLAGHDVVVLAMVTPTGSPLATPMWFVHDETSLGMVSVDGLAKIRHLQADPRVSVVAEDGGRGDSRALVLTGAVRFLAGEERVAWGERFRQKYGSAVEALWGGAAIPDNRQVFVLEPTVASAFGL